MSAIDPIRSRVGTTLRDIQSFPADAALAWKLEGTRGVWRAIADRTISRVIMHGHLVLFAQELDGIADVPLPAGVTVEPFTGDWSALASIAPLRKRDDFVRRAADGNRILVAWQGSRPVGYTWLAERATGYMTKLGFSLPPDAAYLFDLYVPPAFRSSGIGSALVWARLHLARELGFREGWRMVAPRNAPSLRTLAKTAGTGARRLGEVRFVTLFGKPVISVGPRIQRGPNVRTPAPAAPSRSETAARS